MTKYEMVDEILNCGLYEGNYTRADLLAMKKELLEDLYNAMEEAEYDYYEYV